MSVILYKEEEADGIKMCLNENSEEADSIEMCLIENNEVESEADNLLMIVIIPGCHVAYHYMMLIHSKELL